MNKEEVVVLNLKRWPLASGSFDHKSPVSVLDVDVLGVGGRWRRELNSPDLKIQSLLCVSSKEFSDNEAYLHSLAEFLTEQKPSYCYLTDPLIDKLQQQFASTRFFPLSKLGDFIWDLPSELNKLFESCFAHTLIELGDLRQSLLSNFVKDTFDSHWLLAERLRQFPMFIKERFPQLPNDLAQLVFWEWSQLELQFIDLGGFLEGPPGIRINPSLRFFEFRNPRIKEPGLWTVYQSRDSEVRSYRLVPKEAMALDLINEDHNFKPNELSELMSVYNPLLPMSEREARKLLISLCENEIIYW